MSTCPQREMASGTGFSLVEIMIGLVVLAIFFLPLVRNFTGIKRVSLAARDTVIATSRALSLLGRLKTLPFSRIDPSDPGFSGILQEEKTKVTGGSTFTADARVETREGGKVKVLEVVLTFNIPGVQQSDARRTLRIKDFVYASQK